MLREARPTPIQFVYRASPITLESQERSKLSVEPLDPPINVRGMTMVRLDLKMRLSRLLAVPPVTEEGATINQEPDWETLLEYAGIAPESLKRCDSVIVPSRYADARMAWEGVLDGDTEPVRVEAAFHLGKPVSFQVIPIDQLENVLAPPRSDANSFVPYVVVPLLLIVAVNLTLRNFRSGRVDWKGALIVSLSGFATGKLSKILAAKSIPYVLQHPDRLVEMLLDDLWAPLLVFSLYAAIEPMVRRAWPQTLVSWTRMLSGNFTDPLVGRDLLIGCALGGTLVTAGLVNPWFTNHLSSGPSLDTLMGTRQTLGNLLRGAVGALLLSLVYLLVLLVLRLLVKRNWLAIVSFMVLAVLLALIAVFSTGRYLSAPNAHRRHCTRSRFRHIRPHRPDAIRTACTGNVRNGPFFHATNTGQPRHVRLVLGAHVADGDAGHRSTCGLRSFDFVSRLGECSTAVNQHWKYDFPV